MLEPSEPTQHILRGPFWECSSSHGLIDSLSAVSTPVPLSLCSSIVMEQLEVKRGRTLWEASWGLKEPKGHGGGREEREGLKGKSSVPHEWMNSIIIHGLAKATVSGHLESLNFLLSLTVMNNLFYLWNILIVLLSSAYILCPKGHSLQILWRPFNCCLGFSYTFSKQPSVLQGERSFHSTFSGHVTSLLQASPQQLRDSNPYFSVWAIRICYNIISAFLPLLCCFLLGMSFHLRKVASPSKYHPRFESFSNTPIWAEAIAPSSGFI